MQCKGKTLFQLACVAECKYGVELQALVSSIIIVQLHGLEEYLDVGAQGRKESNYGL